VLYYYVAFNTMTAPFNNPLVREALSYATDPKQIIKSVFDGLYPPTEALCSSQTNFCPTKKVSTYIGYDPTKAKKLISQYETQTGQSFPTISLYGFLPTNATLTEAVAQEWEAVGVTVNITIVSVIPTYVTDFRNGTWSAWVQNAVQDSTDPATGTYSMFGVKGLFTGVDDPVLQSMLVHAQSLVNPAARAPLYQQIFQYLDKNAYGIPLYQGTLITATAKNLENYFISGGITVNDENVWLK
jgi:ABC-type transport system substrate-binding protein